ncbi:hypothetical protein [Draconibacterium orientale]|uniref:hypothetical protein n=1 Tax=Draconibacterium orientale TaxID=1168034 RepID=UPI002ABDD2A1|nr:hypothetical protein [Draconibacterium orientale]
MKQHKTSSFVLDIKKSTFHRFNDEYFIYQYTLPPHLGYKKNYFGVLHNWAKSEITQPYFLHFPTKKVYVLIKNGEEPKKISFEDKELPSDEFNQYKETGNIHIWLKVLLSAFLELNSDFISNDTFYIHSELSRDKKWATVLKINLQHDYKEKESIVFNLTDSATRLKHVSLIEYQQYHRKDVPYGLTLKNGRAIFKQLNKSQLNENDIKIFVKPKPINGNRHKSKIDYHSIMDERNHEKSRAFLIQNFLHQYLQYLKEYDISVEIKNIELQRLDKKREKSILQIKDFNVSLVDGRINKKIGLNTIISVAQSFSDSIKFQVRDVSELNSTDCALFVMDYNKSEFNEYFHEDADPYDIFKKEANNLNIPSQGICINENSFLDDNSSLTKESFFNYDGLRGKNLERNLSICITQLYLKSLLNTEESERLPDADLLKEKVFVANNMLFFISNGKLKIIEIESINEFSEIIERTTGRNDILEILLMMHKYHNPFQKEDSEIDMSKFKIIISTDSVWEIVDYPERAFYDDEEISYRIKTRNIKRPISDYKVEPLSDLHVRYNDYIEDKVEELNLSYEELKTKYGKGEDGFIKEIFYEGRELKSYKDTPFRKFLEENNGIVFKGLKENKIFETYSGIWFSPQQLKYFVGRNNSYKSHQDKGFQMKKIIIHDGEFKKDEFFPLLNNDFIRYKELTVNPYPFKLIEMKMEMI